MRNPHLQEGMLLNILKSQQIKRSPEIAIKMWADMFANIVTCLLQNIPPYYVC